MADRCAYATRYIAVKDRYRLPVDPEEKDALHRLLKRVCNGNGVSGGLHQ